MVLQRPHVVGLLLELWSCDTGVCYGITSPLESLNNVRVSAFILKCISGFTTWLQREDSMGPDSKWNPLKLWHSWLSGSERCELLGVSQCREESGCRQGNSSVLQQFSRFHKLYFSFLGNGIVSPNIFLLKSGVNWSMMLEGGRMGTVSYTWQAADAQGWFGMSGSFLHFIHGLRQNKELYLNNLSAMPLSVNEIVQPPLQFSLSLHRKHHVFMQYADFADTGNWDVHYFFHMYLEKKPIFFSLAYIGTKTFDHDSWPEDCPWQGKKKKKVLAY